MKYGKYPVLFCAGGLGYMGLELLWRGWTHKAMFLAGGTCFLLLGQMRHLPPWARALVGAGSITGVELLTGLLVNRGYEVWDYRNVPCNFLGQICLPYSLLWVPVSLLGGEIFGFFDRRISAFRMLPQKGRI